MREKLETFKNLANNKVTNSFKINPLIEEFNKSYLPYPNINKKSSMLNQLKILKKNH